MPIRFRRGGGEGGSGRAGGDRIHRQADRQTDRHRQRDGEIGTGWEGQMEGWVGWGEGVQWAANARIPSPDQKEHWERLGPELAD